jgi:putative intracellular protease/amidase
VLLVAVDKSEDMKFMLTEEVGVMRDLLQKAGYKVVVASESGEPLVGDATTTLKPDLKYSDVKVADYAGFIFPCMAVPDIYVAPAGAVEIAKAAAAQGKPIAAQLGGVFTLAKAGALDGKHYALIYSRELSSVPGATWDGSGVVQDGNIITSGICPYMRKAGAGPDGTVELTQKLVAALGQ